MTDWTSGYVADINYTYGYYQELNPLRAQLSLLSAGIACPTFHNACELGFGQGLSVNIHAAAGGTFWNGTDFNPGQAGFARELTEISGSNAKLYDDAFTEFVNRSDLPGFDYIGLHGIWSWVSDENRSIIVEFIRKKLNVGGVLYISYNTLPGWSAFSPMRHLMTEHAEIIGAEGLGTLNRIKNALDFSDRLLTLNPAFSRVNPIVPERLKGLRQQNLHYLAHEYFNRDWLPMHISSMGQWLEPAKVGYACSANYLDHIDAINLTTDQQAFLAEISDVMFRETVRDFMVNQQFRRDYWVRGPRMLSPLQRSEKLRALTCMLVCPPGDVPSKIQGVLGEVGLNQPIYGPLTEVLSDHRVKTLGQIEQLLQPAGINFSQIVQAVMILSSGGHLALTQDEKVIAKAKKQTAKLNHHLMMLARGQNDIGYLASPVTGGGVPVNRFQQLFVLAFNEGKKRPQEWVDVVWQILQAQSQKIVKEGKALESEEDNKKELLAQAVEFEQKKLPILKALQII